MSHLRIGPVFIALALAACGGGSSTGTVPAEPTQLAILDTPNLPIEAATFSGSVRVEVRDANGARVTSATNTVTLALASNPAGGTLTGQTSVAAVAGVATFTGLSIDKPGLYTLAAASTGLGTTATDQFAVTVHFVSISPNGQHTCGVSLSSQLYCWGANFSGQVGDGTLTNRTTPTPVNVPGSLRFSSVSAGLQDFACARSTTGTVYCWGAGTDGQTAGAGAQTSPTLITLPAAAAAIGLDVGFNHGCALVAGGAAFCWGRGNAAVVAVTQAGGLTFTSISSGVLANCGLDGAGAAWCWGDNDVGQLGDGTQFNRAAPVRVLLPGGVTASAVETGGPNACALTTAGAVYCWGSNDKGQLGDGTTTLRITPVLVQAPAGVTFSKLSVGLSYACAIATSGTSYCWGNNVGSSLGDGTVVNRLIPTPVLAPSGVTFVQIGTGFAHTCAVTAAGSAYCWGQGGLGELGDGATVSHATPTRVAR